MKGYINVYRSGFFHRKGKPGVCDRHGGDIYLTREDAVADIDPPTGYVATVPIEWEDPACPYANPPDSQPVPLSQTRKEFV